MSECLDIFVFDLLTGSEEGGNAPSCGCQPPKNPKKKKKTTWL